MDPHLEIPLEILCLFILLVMMEWSPSTTWSWCLWCMRQICRSYHNSRIFVWLYLHWIHLLYLLCLLVIPRPPNTLIITHHCPSMKFSSPSPFPNSSPHNQSLVCGLQQRIWGLLCWAYTIFLQIIYFTGWWYHNYYISVFVSLTVFMYTYCITI